MQKTDKHFQFLIYCTKSDLTKKEIAYLHTSITDENISISHIIQLAYKHGIVPLVYKTIKQLFHTKNSSLNIDNFLLKLQSHYKTISQRNMLMSAELIYLIKLFAKHNIDALAFKGPTLAQMAYGDITLRQFGDLDILIKKEDIDKIDILFKKSGYQHLLPLTSVQTSVRLKYAKDLSFIHPSKGIHLEMHWAFLNQNYPIQMDLENFWLETQEVKLNGNTMLTFSNENLLVYLAIHGSKHLWERIIWLKDIDLFIQRNEINWGKLINKVSETGFEKMVYLALHLNVILFQTALPASIRNEIKKYPQVVQLSHFIFESWITQKNSFQTTYMQTKLLPGLKAKFIYLRTRLLQPSLDEYLYINLPKGLQWGYFLIKPYRLIKKNVFKN
ncbi:MAG: nucleotidyltransferase family protein [Campylobacterota bacterium]|nr:nucleotidyltransferase family protein [Campylobacterota bacterium]